MVQIMKTGSRLKSLFSINKIMVLVFLAALSILSCKSDDDGIQPLASFEVETNGSFATFTNTSQNSIDNDWSFSDGTFSDEVSPVHRYETSGEYEVFLLTSNGTNTDVASQIITVEVPSIPVPAFSFETLDREVTFTNMSDGATSYTWDFGDDVGISTEENPVYTYDANGTYTVTLTAVNIEDESVSVSQEVEVLEVFPVAGFTVMTTGLGATFTNTSVDAETYSWDFGDGVGVSTEENPVYSYATAGTYTVALTATSANANTTTFEEEVVVVAAIDPVAFFHVDYDGTTLTFTTDPIETGDSDFPFISGSREAVSFDWDFGDGTTSTEANPTHTYAGVSGAYDISLTVTSVTGGTDTYIKEGVDASLLTNGSLDNYVFENDYLGFVVDIDGNEITADSGNYFRDENNDIWETPDALEDWIRDNINDSTVTVGMTTSEHEGTFALKYSNGDTQRRAYQEFSVTSGQTYTVSFYVAVRADDITTDYMTAYIFDNEILDETTGTLASANQSLNIQGTSPAGTTDRVYEERSITFTATGSTAVFYMTVTGGAETFLDTVRIQ